MRYFGSKSSTVDTVVRLALAGMLVETAADAFGGLGTIAAALRRQQVQVTTCDILKMPLAFQHVRVVCSAVPRYLCVRRQLDLDSTEAVLEHLRRRRNPRSWIVREFAKERRFFTLDNAEQIAGAWHEIQRWDTYGWLSTSERSHLVASLINAVDACANTAGTYYAYLKQWHRKALHPFSLSLLPVQSGLPSGQTLYGDALDRLKGHSFDLLYLDPPYTDRDYARYYHFPESLAQLCQPDTNPNSVSGVPKTIGEATPKFRQALRLEYQQRLIENVCWKRLVVQYCDDAFTPLSQLRDYLSAQGRLQEYTLNTLGYTTTSRHRRSKHHVFIVDRCT